MSNAAGKAQEKAPGQATGPDPPPSPLATGFRRAATKQLSLIKAREPASLFAKLSQSEPFGSSHQHKREKVMKQ